MKCELCQVRDAECVLHREKDGGSEELYVCKVCRDGNEKKKEKKSPVKNFPGHFSAQPLAGDSVEKTIQELHDNLAKIAEKIAGAVESGDFFQEAGEEPGGLGEELEFEGGEPNEPACQACGMKRSEFRQGLRMGCAGCYGAFSNEVALLIRDMHKGTRHAREED